MALSTKREAFFRTGITERDRDRDPSRENLSISSGSTTPLNSQISSQPSLAPPVPERERDSSTPASYTRERLDREREGREREATLAFTSKYSTSSSIGNLSSGPGSISGTVLGSGTASSNIMTTSARSAILTNLVPINGAAGNASGSGTNGDGVDGVMPSGYVGFANLPNQVHRRAVKKPFEFNLLVVGQTGLGKSTLLNCLFLTELYSTEYPGPSLRIKKTVSVESTVVNLKENGVNLHLTLIDTPGYGDLIDNTNCWQPILEYIDSRFNEYLSYESRVHRPVHIPDNRVHCCLFFVGPTGHGLKQLDLELLRLLHDKVCIVPIIAKADCMTIDECREFKRSIMLEMEKNKINLYRFPDCDESEENKHLKEFKNRAPYAVIGSNTFIDKGGKKVRARVYPWGTVEVENLEHNDFVALRTMLLRTHMQDLKDVTSFVHYENFRYHKLSGIALESKFRTDDGKDPMAQMEDERKEHEAKLRRMETEMEQVFEMKVREKRQKLKESELDLNRRAEQMKQLISTTEHEIEDRRIAFDRDKEEFERTNKDLLEKLDRQAHGRRSLDNSEEAIDAKSDGKDGKEVKEKKKKKGIFN